MSVNIPNSSPTGTIDINSRNFQVGVDITRVERMYDRYLESQIVDKSTDAYYNFGHALH